MPGPILGSIPSPSSGQLHLGPFRLTAYGLMIALGVIAAVDIARRRHTARGGARDDFSEIAVWAVIAGLLGARAYHVLTDLERFRGHWSDTVKIWEGGLGIPGGLLAGVLVGLWSARRHGLGNAYTLDKRNGATMLSIPFGHAVDALCHCLGEFDSLVATSALRRREISFPDLRQPVVATAEDQWAVSGTLVSGAVASINDWLTRCANHSAAFRCKRVRARLYDPDDSDNVFSNTRLLRGKKSGCVSINRFTADSNEPSGFIRCDTSIHNTTLVV